MVSICPHFRGYYSLGERRDGMHKKENATGFENLPRHIAIIMDGNGRWASKRLLPRTMGHREGMKAIKRVVEAWVGESIKKPKSCFFVYLLALKAMLMVY
jgi:undecaprenyl pyrophosphate synthase